MTIIESTRRSTNTHSVGAPIWSLLPREYGAYAAVCSWHCRSLAPSLRVTLVG